MTVMIIIGLAVASAVLYRLGGTKAGTLWRDLGVPICATLAMIALGNFHWSLIICFGLLYASLTTYNKWVGYFFNRPDKSTVYWESWLVTGLFYGLALLPYCIFQGHWLGFGLRSVVLAAFVCLWSEFIGLDWLEEGGRGAAIILSLLLL